MPWGEATGRFLTRIQNEMRVRQLLRDHQQEMMERLRRELIPLGESDADLKPLWTGGRRQNFFVDLFPEFREITSAITSLEPGDLLHVDVKKLGRIARVGHRITGIAGTACEASAGTTFTSRSMMRRG